MTLRVAKELRRDVQALRAVAVLLVLVFHVWPGLVPGGYVGVDVFFVISGYLITGQLVREFESEQRISLRDFYARRIRRLLPAASLTLVAIAAGAWLFLPATVTTGLPAELCASGLYFENLFLVHKAVDYLALDEQPSPVQHYWSLSVEEQFYIVWPLLIVCVGLVVRQASRARSALRWSLAVVVGGSFAASVFYSFADPAKGYFLTTTRLWELGIGGLLALRAEPAWATWQRTLLGAAGLLAVVAAGSLYSTTLPFPGYLALAPTLGTAALIAARVDESSLLGRLLSLRFLQYAGDVSYSLYLWHWPVIVVYPFLAGRELDLFADRVTVVVISGLLAHISKYAVEDRLRHLGSVRASYALGALCTGLVLASAGALHVTLRTPPLPASEARAEASAYPGAEQLLGHVKVPPAPFRPDAGQAKGDRGPAYGTSKLPRCIGEVTGTDLSFCQYGNPDNPVHVALVGDSHAVHWLPAFERVARSGRFYLSGLTKSGCGLTDVTVEYGAKNSAPRPFTECRAWGDKVLAWVRATRPTLVVLSMSPNHKLEGLTSAESQSPIADSVVRAARVIMAEGIPVAVIKHTPWQREDVPRCMSKRNATVAGCSSKAAEALREGSLNLAAEREPKLRQLDFTRAFCIDEVCPVVVGNVLVYRDAHHLTATFARTLAPELERRLGAMLPVSKP